MLAFIGILSGLIFILGDIPYILDTTKGKTKPHRVSWFLFFTLDIIFIANQYALGASSSLWLVISWTIVTFIILSLSIKRGVGGFAKLDIACILGASAGLLFWYVLKTPIASLVANLVVATIAYIPTIRKAHKYPWTETKISWITASFASLLSAISIGTWNFKLLLLPLWSFVLSIIVTYTIIHRSKLIKKDLV